MRLPSYKCVYWELLLIRKKPISEKPEPMKTLLTSKGWKSYVYIISMCYHLLIWPQVCRMSRARVQTLRQRLSLILTVTCRTAPIMKSCREHQWRFLDHRPQTHSWNPQTCLYIATQYFWKISKWPFAQQSHSKIFHLKKSDIWLFFFPCKIIWHLGAHLPTL